MTGTAAEITPVRSVDRKPVGGGQPGPVTRALREAFFGLFDGRTEDKWQWLDVVKGDAKAAKSAAAAATRREDQKKPASMEIPA